MQTLPFTDRSNASVLVDQFPDYFPACTEIVKHMVTNSQHVLVVVPTYLQQYLPDRYSDLVSPHVLDNFVIMQNQLSIMLYYLKNFGIANFYHEGATSGSERLVSIIRSLIDKQLAFCEQYAETFDSLSAVVRTNHGTVPEILDQLVVESRTQSLDCLSDAHSVRALSQTLETISEAPAELVRTFANLTTMEEQLEALFAQLLQLTSPRVLNMIRRSNLNSRFNALSDEYRYSILDDIIRKDLTVTCVIAMDIHDWSVINRWNAANPEHRFSLIELFSEIYPPDQSSSESNRARQCEIIA